MTASRRSNGKRYTRSAQVERQGVALCNSLVTEMGHIWHERDVDHGIDGEIELVDDGRATNRVLWVQSKARGETNPFTRESERGFRFHCSSEDVEYWTSGTAPVLLVCSHPATGEAWFKHLGTWFADPAHRRGRFVDFDKAADRFDGAVGRRLLELGVDIASAPYLSAVPRLETLTTNLLRVTSLASGVTVGETSCRGWRDANPRLHREGLPPVSDVVFADQRLYTMRLPNDPVVLALLDGAAESIDTATMTSNDAMRRTFAWVLNDTLRDITQADLRLHPDSRVLYFKARPGGRERTVQSRADAKGRGRKVVSKYTPRDDASWLGYTRHFAVHARFEHLDDWYLALTPTYHFTTDGYEDFPFAETQLAGVKRLEGHEAVRRLTQFWADYLTWRPSLLSTDPDPRLQFGGLVTVDVDRGIDDRLWKPRSQAVRDQLAGQLALQDIESEVA